MVTAICGCGRPGNPPIATAGIPHGLAEQSTPILVQAQGDFGDVIQVNLQNDLNTALDTPQGVYQNFHLLLSSFTNGAVAILPVTTSATATDQATDVLEQQGAARSRTRACSISSQTSTAMPY